MFVFPLNEDVDAFPLKVAGETLHLLADKLCYWEDRNALILADLHLGKGTDFQKAGIPLPDEDTPHDLARLSRWIDHFQASQVIIVGDLFHGLSAATDWVLPGLTTWRATQGEVRLTLVPGNHDRVAKAVAEELGLELTAEVVTMGPLSFSHYEPAGEADPFTISGHLHPAVRIKEDGGPGMTLPAFIFNDHRLVLPAFGSFTGSAKVLPHPQDRVFALVEGGLLEINPKLCR